MGNGKPVANPGASSAEWSALLRKIALFSTLGDAEMSLLTARMQDIALEPQQDIMVQGKEPDAVYFLREGKVEILVNGEMVALKDTVECFGEMSCLTGEKAATATVRTATKSRALKISRPDFLAAVDQIPKLWRSLFLQMNGRFRAMNSRLSEVLAHTPQGLIKIDSKARITNEFSIQCAKFFATHDLAGKPFQELAFSTNEAVRKGWEKTYPVIFEDANLDFNLLADLLPKDTKIRSEKGDLREYVLSYYPCRSGGGTAVEAVDIGMEDVTDAREFARKTEALEAEKQTLRKIYDNPDSYMGLLSLMDEVVKALAPMAKALETGSITPDALTDTLRLLHNLKGFSGQFALTATREATHAIENQFQGLRDLGAPPEGSAIRAGISTLINEAKHARELIDGLSCELRDRLLGIVFKREDFEKLKGAVAKGDTNVVNALVAKAERIDARELVHGWGEEAARLAATLGKQIIFKVEGESSLVPKTWIAELQPPLIHLLRNSVDHGIETPEKRRAAGKGECGTIRVFFEKSDEALFLKISDDGGGIDYAAVLKTARANKTIAKEAEKLAAAKQEWKILFLPGFSTAKTVTEVSGRGVGLDAVQKAVEEAKGTIEVETHAGQGTTFTIRLPVN